MIDVNRLEQLEDAATEGPWMHDGGGLLLVDDAYDNHPVFEYDEDENGDLIVAMRNAMPALLRYLRAMHDWDMAMRRFDLEQRNMEAEAEGTGGGTMIRAIYYAIAALALGAIVAAVAFAGPPAIYAPDGTYLGVLSANEYDPDSVSNRFGRYGDPYSPDSINNPYGRYGDPYSPDSVTNPYAVSLPPLEAER